MLNDLQSKDDCIEILAKVCSAISSLRNAVKSGIWTADLSSKSVESTLQNYTDFREQLKLMEPFLKPIEDASFTADREKWYLFSLFPKYPANTSCSSEAPDWVEVQWDV